MKIIGVAVPWRLSARIAHLRRALEEIARAQGNWYAKIARDALHDDDVTVDIAENGPTQTYDDVVADDLPLTDEEREANTRRLRADYA